MNPDFPVVSVAGLDRDKLNSIIVDFNLGLQTKFKENGHKELYMMDDTSRTKPNDSELTLAGEKTYLHCINGKANLKEEGESEDLIVNSS